MTCVVGLEKRGTVWIGADSAGTASDMRQQLRADEKVFKLGEMLIGICGSFRMGNLLRYKLELPEHRAAVSDMEYLVGDFVSSVKTLLDNAMEGSFLVGYKGKLYHVQSDFQVGRTLSGFDA